MRVEHLLAGMLLLLPLTGMAEDTELPSLELLEYLGEWQDEAGNEVDPHVLALLQAEAVREKGDDDEN